MKSAFNAKFKYVASLDFWGSFLSNCFQNTVYRRKSQPNDPSLTLRSFPWDTKDNFWCIYKLVLVVRLFKLMKQNILKHAWHLNKKYHLVITQDCCSTFLWHSKVLFIFSNSFPTTVSSHRKTDYHAVKGIIIVAEVFSCASVL